MIEPREEKSDKSTNKPLAWFFIVMILLNPFLAPLLVVLLKTNIEPLETLEEEPDVLWDFFESIDRTLSFPMASAESLPQSPLYKLHPEFLRGTAEHPKDIADAMDANMQLIAPPIISFLEKNKHEKVVVLGIGEYHLHVGLLTTNIFAVVKAWEQQYPNTNITVIREAWNPLPGFEQQINQVFTYFHAPNADEKSEEYKNKLDLYLSHYCFNEEGILGSCATLSAKARQFSFTFTTASADQTPQQEKERKALETLANNYRHPTGDIRFLDITKTTGGQVTNDDLFPHEMKTIDHRITKTIQNVMQAHKYLNPHQQLILVVWFGANHALAVSHMLDTQKIPHHLLSMPYDFLNKGEKKRELIGETIKRYATSCILPKDKCPPEIHEFAQIHAKKTQEIMVFRFCVLPIPYDKRKCDRVLHENNQFLVERNIFSQNVAHQVPPLLPSELPKKFSGRKISYFFATEKSVKFVQEEMKTQKIEQERDKKLEL